MRDGETLIDCGCEETRPGSDPSGETDVLRVERDEATRSMRSRRCSSSDSDVDHMVSAETQRAVAVGSLTAAATSVKRAQACLRAAQDAMLSPELREQIDTLDLFHLQRVLDMLRADVEYTERCAKTAQRKIRKLRRAVKEG